MISKQSLFFFSTLPRYLNAETMHQYMILFGVFYLSVVRLSPVQQERRFVTATVGDNVTLKCFYNNPVAMHFSWYRLGLGGGLQLLSTVYKYEELSKADPWMQKNPRLSLQRGEGIHHLHISEVQFSDSASYFCGSSHSNIPEFGDGVFLSVQGAHMRGVDQTPLSETIQPGGSVNLRCAVHTGTCDDMRTVYWVRHGSNRGILQTHEEGCEQFSPEESLSPSCVYNLQKLNLSSSDAGTYFCAVASCGEIIFGNGSKLLFRDDANDQMLHTRILILLSIMRTCLLTFFAVVCYFIYRYKS